MSMVIFSGVFIINIFAIISIIFIEKKNPTSALAWIIVLNVLPIFGFIFYFFLGSSQKLKLSRKKYKLDIVEDNIIKVIKKNNKFKEIKKLDSVFSLNNNNYLNSVTNNNNVKLYSDMNLAIKDVFKDMMNAKESIHVSFFIFNTKSDVGTKFINILTKKAKEGVKIKFTYDRLGSHMSKKKHFKELKKAGAEVYKHLPNIFRTLFQSNYRNHRKMIIIDSKIAYTGGMNISDEYLSLDKKITPWRDTFARITGGSVMFIQSRFLIDFVYLKKLTLKRKYKDLKIKKEIQKMFGSQKGTGNELVQFTYNGPDTNFSYIRDGYIKMINEAKKNIVIETPYFIPDESILDAIRIARSSGVDVSIIIPGVPDKKYVYYVTLSFIDKLLEYGVKVYSYNGFIHTKMLICDNEYVSLGTCNFDTRSFRLNYENNLFIKSKKVTKQALNDFKKDLVNSKEITKKEMVKQNKIQKFIGLIFRLFSPVL